MKGDMGMKRGWGAVPSVTLSLQTRLILSLSKDVLKGTQERPVHLPALMNCCFRRWRLLFYTSFDRLRMRHAWIEYQGT